MKFNAQRIPKMYKVNKTFRLNCKKKKKKIWKPASAQD